MSFSKLNTLIGWLIFLIAASVYIKTAEDTASFWDCGEFIAVSYKLEVPHPPGAPFFLLIGRLFSFLAFGNVLKVAFWINMVSALSSAFTILFLFWSITHLACRLISNQINTDYTIISQKIKAAYTIPQTLSILGSGVVGALAYTFSDSFWFSAAEAEVYGLSSFFTAFVVWAMLKWETIEDESDANRWLLLIAYMMGLSIGVHLLNLLTIPALALVYHFKKEKNADLRSSLIALGIGMAVLVVVNGSIPALPTIAGHFEVLFVNSFGLPFGSGAATFMLLFVGIIVYGIRKSIMNNNVTINTALLAFSFIMIGYFSYAVIIIRSNNDTPIDENNPEDVMTFVSYLKREQYGDRPLLYGHSFTSERVDTEKGEALYRKGDDKYEIYDYKVTAKYDPSGNMPLPRIYSQSENHKQLYMEKLGLKPGEKPTFAHNLRFLFGHQLGHMYMRYFMWNFAGRESDDKEAGWLSPFSPTDVPEELANNKARDNFYMLPLFLGLLGLLFQYNKDTKSFVVVGLLFLIMGIALVLYLNSPPVEPRERDYVYVGSFYAFCFWIGFSVLAVSEILQKMMPQSLAPALASVLCLFVPMMMGVKGWDNHDRTGRYMSVDQARNTLASCAPNAILFTGGDNDTFPLWYVQEVEGFRTDVRVVVLSYFQTDWYIDQMKRKVYDSDPLPISAERQHYIQGTNDYLYVVEDEKGKNGINLRTYLKLLKDKNPVVQVPLMDGTTTGMVPSRKLILDVDSAAVIAKGFIPKGKEKRVVSQMEIGVEGGGLAKSDYMILDILATSNWERPIYFNNTSANTCGINIRNYLQMEGLTYRLMPVLCENTGDTGEVSADVMLENLKKFQFRGLGKSNAYYDDEYKKFAANYQNMFWRLGFELMSQGKRAEAEKVIDQCFEVLPDETIPFNYYIPRLAELYYLLDKDEKANALCEKVGKRAEENLRYLIRKNLSNLNHSEIQMRSLMILNQLASIYKRGEDRAARKIEALQQNDSTANSSEIETLKKRQKAYSEAFERYEKAFSEVYPQLQ